MGNPTPKNLKELRRQLDMSHATYQQKKEAFEKLEETLEVDFKAQLKNSLTEAEQDIMLEGDIDAIDAMLNNKRQTFIYDKVDIARDELEALEDALEKNEDRLDDLTAEDGFRKKYPDIDEKGFADFINPQTGEMSPKDREELLVKSNGDKTLFLGLMAEKFLVSKGIQEEEKPLLPEDLSLIAGEGGDVDAGEDASDEDEDYLAEIGMS